jgi:outer membrane receptor protein involved in Fe transport
MISLASGVASSVASAAGGSSADHNQTYPFDIAAGEAAQRLNDFSSQSGLQLLFGFELMKGIQLRGVHGHYKPFDALEQMIAGTNVRYELINQRTVTLTLAQKPASKPKRKIAAREARWDDRRSPETAVDEVTIQSEYVSTSSPLGLQRLTLGRTDIEATDFVTVAGIIKTLPQIFGGGPTEDTQIGFEAPTNAARGNGVNLRGLGASATLVLMNGRRLAGGGSEGLFVDVSNLPLAAVERMDILPDSSSTVYGADAVGGVVNFVMRDSYDGRQTEAYFGGATQGQLNESYLSQLVGGHWDRGRGLLAFDFHSRDSLPAADRAQAASDLRAFGGDNFDVPQSNPGNIVIRPRTWAIPSGQDGTQLSPADLELGAPNLRGRYEGADHLPSQQRWSGYATGRQELTDSVTLFADSLFGVRDVRGRSGGFGGNFVVPVTNPFLVHPLGIEAPVSVAYNFGDDLGSRITEAHVRTTDITGGLEWRPGAWKITTAATYAAERLRSTTDNIVDSAALNAALADPDPATAFNPFGDGSHTNPATLEAIRTRGAFSARSSMKSASLIAVRPLASLWDAEVVLTAGADYRDHAFSSRNRATLSAPQLSSDLQRSISSAFAELRIPLSERIEVSLASRFEHYSDFGNARAARYGLSWRALESVKLRGTYSESFRPPGLADLDEAQNAYAVLPLPDPQAGGLSSVLVWRGKNRDLQLEKAHSWTAGVEFEPLTIPTLATALTYFDIRFSNRLNSPEFSTDLLSSPALAPLVTRDPTAEFRADVCARAPISSGLFSCFTTPVVAIVDLRTRNDAFVRTRGFDLITRYRRDTLYGRLSFGFSGTYIIDFAEAKSSSLPLADRVSTPNYPVNFRVRVSAGWQRGPFNFNAFLNFLNDYEDAASVPARHVSSWTTVDLKLAYSFGAVATSEPGKTTLSLGADNLFNRSPPFLNNPVGVGYDQENGDLMGRVVSLTVRRKW